MEIPMYKQYIKILNIGKIFLLLFILCNNQCMKRTKFKRLNFLDQFKQ